MRAVVVLVETTNELVVKSEVVGERDQRLGRDQRAEGAMGPGDVAIEQQPSVGAKPARDDPLARQDRQSADPHLSHKSMPPYIPINREIDPRASPPTLRRVAGSLSPGRRRARSCGRGTLP